MPRAKPGVSFAARHGRRSMGGGGAAGHDGAFRLPGPFPEPPGIAVSEPTAAHDRAQRGGASAAGGAQQRALLTGVSAAGCR